MMETSHILDMYRRVQNIKNKNLPLPAETIKELAGLALLGKFLLQKRILEQIHPEHKIILGTCPIKQIMDEDFGVTFIFKTDAEIQTEAIHAIVKYFEG